MSYQVLARKWRPRRFQEMVGQEPILRMLSNALDQKRLHHAYLFTGTRGVGKTTLGRLLAKCLNCETGITSHPCETCKTCIAIDKGQFLDLFEVDAASRTKVEDTRDLLDNVLYPPTQGRFKIYLIDEVHMLSNHSFNALLKTLEEPPEHVKFIFATTDPKRLPITILSRCLQFHLKRIPIDLIAQHLERVCQIEKISTDNAALMRLAKAADGSMRDALSLLDQAIAYGHGKVTAAEVTSMLGTMAQDDLLPLVQALSQQDGNAIYQHITTLANAAPDFNQVLEELISLLHRIALLQCLPQIQTADDEALLPLINAFSPEDIQLYYQIALLARRDLAYAATPQQGFEMALLRMLAFKLAPQTETSAPKITSVPVAKPTPVPVAPKISATPAAVSPTLKWAEIVSKLGLSGMAHMLAANCSLTEITENKILFTLSAKHAPMLTPKLQDRFKEALSQYFTKELQLVITITNEAIITPVMEQQHDQDQRLKVAKQQVLANPHVTQLVEMYDATVEVSLLD